jgi:hypothetical protein
MYLDDPTFVLVFGIVVLARCVLPFTILRWPLPGIVACLVLDAADQTILQSFGFDPPFYQSYDKAMDVFYLGIAYIATLRNWVNLPALSIARFLFFYRQVGVVLFELSGMRALLLVFTNAFEYYFIAYEAVRTRWSVARIAFASWLVVAAAIWVFVKLPQEYWIHIAQLDFTDAVRDVGWFLPLLLGLAGVAALVLWKLVWPRVPASDHRLCVEADPVPASVATPQGRADWARSHGRIWSAATLEKTALVGLLAVVFATLIPDLDLRTTWLLGGTGVFVVINAALSLAVVRSGRAFASLRVALPLRLSINLALLLMVEQLLYAALPLTDAVFFATLFTVLVVTYDLYRPAYELRQLEAARATTAG